MCILDVGKDRKVRYKIKLGSIGLGKVVVVVVFEASRRCSHFPHIYTQKYIQHQHNFTPFPFLNLPVFFFFFLLRLSLSSSNGSSTPKKAIKKKIQKSPIQNCQGKNLLNWCLVALTLGQI